ncbi:VPLPA-CTERM sorting domain-containing protein [Primorskyibacter sp. S187A]|uniref:VPLPA-CTERM sorting domain-containing protein n=1 Tax=Primorskyibacter sp. S187A TaxID=3415130 RepID=UPI003C7D16F3
MKLFVTTAAAALFSASTSYAALLTFDGAACNDGACGTDSETLSQSYGDIVGEVDVVYDANRATSDLEDLFYWGPDYETLDGVAYGVNGGGGLSIVFNALSGFSVSVTSFDIAPYANRLRDTIVQVIDLADGTLLEDDAYATLSTDGVTNYTGDYSSDVGIQINLGPDAWDVGIDNIAYTTAPTTTTAPVPLPASVLLMLGALGGMAALRKKS